MGKHEDPRQREPDSGDDKDKDDGKDTSRHSVEDDKQTATMPNPENYK